MPVSTSYISDFRRRIQDVRPSKRAMTIVISDPLVTTGLAEVTGGRFITTVAGGSAPALDLDLTNTRYDTIGKLYQVLSRAPGYAVQLDPDANTEQVSTDLEGFPPLSIQNTGVELQHHLFADSELQEILREATLRHNPSFDLESMPPQEWVFVLMLAQAGVARIQAYDASKRRGLDKDVTALLDIALAHENTYKSDVSRLARAIQSPKEANPNTMDAGDVVMGDQVRRSLRTGMVTPLAATSNPSAPVLHVPDERDAEDQNIRVRWERNKDVDFFSFELWMDTRPEVVRTHEGSLLMPGANLIPFQDPHIVFGGYGTNTKRPTTSKMVYRAFGANSSWCYFGTFIEELGQLTTQAVVGALESSTQYYFRLYITNLNFLTVGSNVVQAQTKSLRAKFISPSPNPNNPSDPTGSPFSAVGGIPGSTFNVTLDSSFGAFTTMHQFVFGGKPLINGSTCVINTPYSLTITVPTFENITAPKDLSIVSPTQLVDVRHNVFQVQPTP